LSKKNQKKAIEEDTHDPFQDMLFREIEEDLRVEKLKKIWDKYSIVVFAVMAIIIATVGGKYAIKSWDTYVRTKDSNIYLNAVKAYRGDNTKLANDELTRLQLQAKTNYDDVAAYKQALISADKGDFSKLEKISNSDNPFNEVASITVATQYISDEINGNNKDKEAYKNAIKSLELKKNPTSPWRGSALELSAIASIKDGDIEKARTTLQAILDDEYLTQNVKKRAMELLATFPKEENASNEENSKTES
jgi:hypothetical protein